MTLPQMILVVIATGVPVYIILILVIISELTPSKPTEKKRRRK